MGDGFTASLIELGLSPEEFYYVASENGNRKTYYKLINDDIVRQYTDIPKEFLAKIKPRDPIISRAIKKRNLIGDKNKWLNKIQKIDSELKAYADIENYEKIIADYEKLKKSHVGKQFHDIYVQNPKSINNK